MRGFEDLWGDLRREGRGHDGEQAEDEVHDVDPHEPEDAADMQVPDAGRGPRRGGSRTWTPREL